MSQITNEFFDYLKVFSTALIDANVKDSVDTDYSESLVNLTAFVTILEVSILVLLNKQGLSLSEGGGIKELEELLGSIELDINVETSSEDERRKYGERKRTIDSISGNRDT
jgi:hypothetical protein